MKYIWNSAFNNYFHLSFLRQVLFTFKSVVFMEESRIRLRIFVGLIVVMLSVLGGRLVQLQLIESEIYSGESHKNSVHTQQVRPSRGLMYDRNGVLLVDNEPSYTITLTPRYFDEKNIPLLAQLLGVSDSVVVQRLEEARAWSPFKPSRSFREVPFERFSRIQENQFRLPGVDYEIEEKRRYHHVRASHVFGYVKEISAAQLARKKKEGYRMGDVIGQAGLERFYEPYLRGKYGERFVLVNVHGQVIGPYNDGAEDIPPRSGYDLHLTLDHKLQQFVEHLFVNKRGAAIAMNPQTGEILAMVSMPDYDPALLAGIIDPEVWKALNVDPYTPLFNRATMSMQPPGSTFKPFMALVGLHEGVIGRNTRINCPGGFYYGRFFKCHGGAHGLLTVKEAIKLSCNTFFFDVMMRLNFGHWSAWGRKFGFGQSVPIDLPEQRSGIMPDSAYFDRQYGKGRWTPGYLVSLGIGQGDVSLTPLQLVRYAAAVANGGMLVTPHLVREIRHPETGEHRLPELAAPVDLGLNPRYLKEVQEGMRLMVMENNSTVKWGNVVVAGKTGTAQNPHGKDHSWFMGYAPYEHPEIVVAVLVENGGFGASVAAPMAGLIMEYYLTGEISPQKRWVYQLVMQAKSEEIIPDSLRTDWQQVERAQLSQGEFFVPTARDIVRGQ